MAAPGCCVAFTASRSSTPQFAPVHGVSHWHAPLGKHMPFRLHCSGQAAAALAATDMETTPTAGSSTIIAALATLWGAALTFAASRSAQF
jgi:hypothetical protein